MKLGKLIGVLLAVLVLIPVGASAQSQFAGNVQDDTGGALPGVTVTAASEALIEGSRLAVTDGTDQYQIIVKVGFEHSWAWHINTRSTNANLFQVYGDDPNPFGIITPIVDANSSFASTNLAAGTAPGLIGDPRSVTVYNDPSIARVNIDYDSGIYAQDSWTIDRLTINYGGRFDFAKSSVDAVTKPAGRFTRSVTFRQEDLLDIPRFGPDFSPRFSLAYDAFGNGKTALKFGFNRYQNGYGDSWPRRYQPALQDSESRLWNDITLGADGLLPAGCSLSGVGCADPYGTNGDNIAQDWKIGTTANSSFGFRETDLPADDLSRGHQDLLTIGIQQEVRPGLSVSAEWRRRWFRNPEFNDNTLRSFSDFGDPIQVVAPLPYIGTLPIYNIDPAVRPLIAEVDANFDGDGYKNEYTGFELSFQGRLDGGGSVFGGWSMDTPGTSWFSGGGLLDGCSIRRGEDDDPNSLRFCDAFSYPTPCRHEFKVAGNYPLPWYDLMVAGTVIANAGGYAGDAISETRSFTRTSDRYTAPFYTAVNCTGTFVLGAPIITNANGGVVSPTVGTSTTSNTQTLLPGNSVKSPPTGSRWMPVSPRRLPWAVGCAGRCEPRAST